jgi:GrpB-like predicted nucleotidyltransferase (UPF0157 family)
MKELKNMSLEELWKLFPIILKEHNPEYKIWYEEEKDKLKAILKEYDIYRTNHIGSTSVEGLAAKPTVDILLEIKDGYDVDEIIGLLQNNGWILMGRDEGSKNALDFNKGYTPKGFAQKVYHLHIKHPADWGELYFRDYLQKHPDIAGEYENLKLGLREQFEHNRDAYTDAKSDFVLMYTQKAREEFGNRYLPIV